MATHVFYTYAPHALVYNPQTAQFTLSPDYDWRTDRYRIEVTDDDNFADGDASNNEVGEDANQIATVYDGNGNVVASGRIYVEQYANIQQSGGGTTHMIDRFEIGGQHMGYSPSTPLTPGETYDFVDGDDVDNNGPNGDTRMTYDAYEAQSVPCFGPGTLIDTLHGDVPVEWLGIGEMLRTRDDGFQPVLWVGSTRRPVGYFWEESKSLPIKFARGALGPDSPNRALTLTGNHRVLVAGPEVTLLFGLKEALAPAKAWEGQAEVLSFKPEVAFTVWHVLCASHQIIRAQNAWVESFLPAEQGMAGLSAAALDTIGTALEGRPGPVARPCLTVREARLMLSDKACGASAENRKFRVA